MIVLNLNNMFNNKKCIRCNFNIIKPTFIYYCRGCYKMLIKKFNLRPVDLLLYLCLTFDISPDNYIIYMKPNFEVIYNYFLYHYKLTKRMAELLEIVLFLKINYYKFLLYNSQQNYFTLSNK
jgi:hypothetical protein